MVESIIFSLNLDTLLDDLDKANEESINKFTKSKVDQRKIEKLEATFE